MIRRDDFSDDGSVESSAPASCVPDVRYQDLKRRVSVIKESQCSQAVEIVADREEWARERLQFRTIQSEQQCHIAELKAHLASVIDRTTRIRNAYEKEKKQLQSQVQKLQNGNVRLKEQHSLAEENMRSLHASELSAKDGDIRLLQERCDDAIKQNEVQRTGSAAKQVKLYEQYRGWLHEAKQEHSKALQHERVVQETFKADLERSHARTHDLQSELESKKHLNGDLSRQVADLATRLDKRRAQEDSLKARVEVLEKEVARVQADSDRNLRQMAHSCEERLEKYKHSHQQDMNVIHNKVKDVVNRKESTIQRLQDSLEAAEDRIVAYENEARCEKLRVLESMHW